jgi:5-methyltetrahydrofolate--homocysteine methyltransferase
MGPMAKRESFLARLSLGTLVLDGGMGTELMKRGLKQGESPENWILNNPDPIRAVHASYDAAGSEALYTCTFGANRVKLGKIGMAERAVEINAKAVEITRSARKNAKWLIGSMGPTGELLEPYGDMEEETARAAFAEQAKALVGAGVDAIVAETFSDPNEITLAIKAARAAGDVGVLATMTFEKGRTMMGTTPEKAAEAMLSAGADAVGANCGTGPAELVEVIKRMRAAFPKAILIAKPNAGMPVLEGGRTVYPLSPDDFGKQVKILRDLGVTVVGGCCGTNSEHIRLVGG